MIMYESYLRGAYASHSHLRRSDGLVSRASVTQRWSLPYVPFFSCVCSLTILSIFQFPSHHRQHQAIANHVEANNLQANPETKKKFNLFVGASVGPEVEDRWANMDM